MKTVTAEVLASLTEEAASQMHESWKQDYLAKNPGKPRFKQTKFGLTWGKANTGKPWCKFEGSSCSVDISALDLKDLPKDWKGENLAAASAAFEAVLEGTEIYGSLTDEAKVYAAVKIHGAWVGRRIAAFEQKPATAFDDYDRQTLALCVPWSQLSTAEQAKDLDQVKIAAEKLGIS